MTPQALTKLVAERVMNWTAGPNRFMLGRRKWIPSWRFRPCEIFEHAIQLLDAARPATYSLGADRTGRFWATVEIGGVVGEARDRSRPRAVTIAVARAVGIDVDEVG
jgi:hypothetical protein